MWLQRLPDNRKSSRPNQVPEIGGKRPSGPSAELLHLLNPKGLKALL
jgi:hypothetical protein